MIKTKTYQNGMKLVVETNPNALSSECLFHFNVGALNEREYEQGYAHFLEHMLSGESTNKRSIKEINQVYLLSGSDLDASTGYDVTEYSFVSLSKDFDKCFEALCEGLFDCAFSEEEFEREKKIILQEHGVEDNYDDLIDNMVAIHFDNQYPRFLEGDKQSIEGANLELLKDFYTREYIPSNLLISVYGNKTFEEIEHLVESNIFSRIDRDIPKQKVERNNISQPIKPHFYTLKNDDAQTSVTIFFPTEIKNNPISSVFINALNGYSGMLYEKLRLEEPLVYGVSIDTDPLLNITTLDFQCSNQEVSKCLTKVKSIFQNIAQNGISREELISAKTQIQLELILQKDSSNFKVQANAKYLQENWGTYSLENALGKYNKVSNEDIKNFAKSILESKYIIGAEGKYVNFEQLFAYEPSLYVPKFGKFKKFRHLKRQAEYVREIEQPAPTKHKIEENSQEK